MRNPENKGNSEVASKKNSRHGHTNNANLLNDSLRRTKASFRDGLGSSNGKYQ
jgi:hypothetical protein